MTTLLIAETWGQPPWIVMGSDHPKAWERWRWIIRQREYMAQRARREQAAQEDAERQAKGNKWQKR